MRLPNITIDASRNVNWKLYDIAEKISIGGYAGLALSGVTLAIASILKRFSNDNVRFKDEFLCLDPETGKCGYIPKEYT